MPNTVKNQDPSFSIVIAKGTGDMLNTGLSMKEKEKMKTLFYIFLFSCVLMIIAAAAPVHASKVRTVEGIVQNITGNSIQVRGKYYDITGTVLKDPSGKDLKKTALNTGKKVEIFFQEDRITSILIYEDMVE